MPIKAKQYTVEANLNWPDKRSAPTYTWYGEMKLVVNNIVLSDKECEEIMGKVAGLFIGHSSQLKDVSFRVTDVEWETREEDDYEEIDSLENTIANWEIEDVEGQETLAKKKEKLAKLYETYPEKAPQKPEDIHADYEQAVADLKPEFHEDLKCDDEEA